MKLPINELVPSVMYSDKEIILAMRQLFLDNDNFELDPTYSVGQFYKEIPAPKLKFDLEPQVEGCKKADCRNLPLMDNSIKSIIFDPPFMFGKHGKTDENIMTKRFSMFDDWDELKEMYQDSLSEFARILEPNGILAFKCQDYTDSKTTLTHCYVWKWALERGFKVKDLFVKVAKGGRIYNSNLIQRHARKYHSYWFSFRLVV